MLANKTVQCRK